LLIPLSLIFSITINNKISKDSLLNYSRDEQKHDDGKDTRI
jgi:hypothetical protein